MFYRRKVILSLVELLGGEVEKLRLQKLLFLYSMKKSKPEYDFIPYKYGCYSYSAKADLNTMVAKGMLFETEKQYIGESIESYFGMLKSSDKKLVQQVVDDYGKMSSNTLIKHTYINFPFYAIKSTIAKDILTTEYYERVQKAQPKVIDSFLYTVGYEGISLEKYLQKLLINDVRLLVDVRKNPLSMKFGFSKSQLKKYCSSLGISYIHFPELGINSDKRQELKTQADYDDLFDDYQNTTLTQTEEFQDRIINLIEEHQRIALTCFEAEPCQCHRSHLANKIINSTRTVIKLKHL